ncbi:hypothetical protein DCAR_0934539 [Daucus carota subsp. sativus]|uniref:Secreted protein n=1 Tax=Daucus carota subsp. sativus TaxID=79200 RepID=A0A175YKH3_DAUCS|nr:hypothetical protein DCAR_0934539 [Daucus carota subsp. sativus]
MATQTGLTIIVLVLVMSIAEIKGRNRFGTIDMVAPCCRKGGAVHPSAESLTPAPSPTKLPLTSPPSLADLLTYRRGTGQQVVRTQNNWNSLVLL